MSYSLFIALPLPLKILAILVGGFFFVGVRNAQVMEEEIKVQAVNQAGAAKNDAAVDPPVAVRPKAAIGADIPAAANAPKVITVVMHADGSYKTGKDKINAAQLETKLKVLAAAQPGISVLLKADKEIPMEKVQAAVKLCQKVGVKKVIQVRELR